jgi:hypothetical protein
MRSELRSAPVNSKADAAASDSAAIGAAATRTAAAVLLLTAWRIPAI